MNYKDITDETIVLAWANGMRLFDFYPSLEAAWANAARANTSIFTKDEDPKYVPMTFGEYQAKQRKEMLGAGLTEITAEQWFEALEVLPPMKWHTSADGVNKFLMCEFYTASFTNQYARLNGRFFTRMVDAYDQTTWITAKEIEAMQVPARV